MRKYLLIVFVFASFFSKAQTIQQNNAYGLVYKATGGTTALILPNDTIVRERDSNYVHIAEKSGTLWVFNKTVSIHWREIANVGGSVVNWGDIGGTLSNQTDLQALLNAKQNTLPTGTTAQYIAGNLTLQNLDSAIKATGDPRYALTTHSHPGLAPIGGSTGQVLKKVSGTDFDYIWANDNGGLTGADTLSLDNRINQKQSYNDTTTYDATRYWVQSQNYLTDAATTGDTTIFQTVIDSTGQAGQRVLFSSGSNIKSDGFFLYDSTNNKLVINHNQISIGGPSTKLFVKGNAEFTGQLKNGYAASNVVTDTTTYKPISVDASGNYRMLNRWPGGGSTGITQVVAGNGLTNVNDSTLKVDTAIVATKQRVKDVADSLGVLIGTGITQSQLDDSTTSLRTDLATNSALQDTAAAIRGDIASGYTDEQAQDAVGGMVSSEFTYIDATPSLSINTIAQSKITNLSDTFAVKQRKINYSDSSLKISNDSLFFRDYVNVKSFGAVGDGTSNDRTAFANAIATGRTVFVPAGTYLLSSSVTLNVGQTIFGAGWNSVIKVTYNGRGIINANQTIIRDLKFLGPGKAGGNNFNTGILATSCVGFKIYNCMFEGFSGDPGQNGGGGICAGSIASDNSDGGVISNCYFYNNDAGLNLMQRAEYVAVTNNTFGSNTVALCLGGGNNSAIGNVIQGNTTGIKGVDGTNSAHNLISGNLINHNIYPLWLEDVAHNTGYEISSNMIYYGAIKIIRSKNVKFADNHIQALDSVFLDGAKFITRSGGWWGLTSLNATIPIRKYNGAEDFAIFGETRYDSATANYWVKQNHADTVQWYGPMYHTGTTPSSSSSSDSVWVKDATTGQWKLRAQSSIGGGSFSKAITIESPTSSENIGMFYTDVAITITKLAEALRGTSPSVTYNINHSTDRSSGSPNLLFSSDRAATSTTGTTTTTFNDATIPAGSWVWLTTSATSGTISSINITLIYTKD